MWIFFVVEYQICNFSFVPIESKKVLGHTVIKMVSVLNQFFNRMEVVRESDMLCLSSVYIYKILF